LGFCYWLKEARAHFFQVNSLLRVFIEAAKLVFLRILAQFFARMVQNGDYE
jgi:hypothetical protein